MILTETKFEFRGQSGKIALDEYSLGGTCLLFLEDGEDPIGGSPIPISLRIPGSQPTSHNQVYIKNYGELEGILVELDRQGIVKPTNSRMWVRLSPWASAPLVTLSEEISRFLPFPPSPSKRNPNHVL